MADAVSLFEAAYTCLMTEEIEVKLTSTRKAAQAWQAGELSLQEHSPPAAVPAPGRPSRPELVPPRRVKQRNPASPQGRAALIHALTHIEFNAINLAWDAVYRFRGLPAEFYSDWIQVAVEEAYHFELLAAHLNALGYAYGDFPAHNSLWEMAKETAYDPLTRMALVPRVLEARGLDVTPGIMEKLRKVGDLRAVEILEIIFRDEIGHVAAGTRWFNYLCAQRDVEPVTTFRHLIDTHLRSPLRPPFHLEARSRAGFSKEELAVLESLGEAERVK